MTKADRIRAVLHLGNKAIAVKVGVGEAYVRAVRQRTDENGRPKVAPASAAWQAAHIERHREHVWDAMKRAYDRNKAARAQQAGNKGCSVHRKRTRAGFARGSH